MWRSFLPLGSPPALFSFVRTQTQNAIRSYYADKVFLGAKAVLVQEGYLADVFELEVHLKRVMIDPAQEVVLVTESRKFREVAFFKICELQRVQRIFTDEHLDLSIVTQLENIGIQVVRVPVGKRV